MKNSTLGAQISAGRWQRRTVVGAMVAAGLLASFAEGCGSKSLGDPCETTLAGQCGGPCQTDGQCSAGIYCGPAGVCTADCGPGARSCNPGATCTVKGRCIAAPGLSIGGGGGADLEDGGACAETRSRGEGLPADLYIMNDQSDSMSCAIPTGGNRWDAMKSALSQFLQSPAATGMGVGLQYFGLAAGGGRRGGGPGGITMGSCDPAVYTPADVEIGSLPGNAQPLIGSLNRHGPSTYTPTPAALQGAINHARAWATAHPAHYVAAVLATDGEPNVGLCGDNDTSPSHLLPIVAQIAADGFSSSGGMPSIPTYVIGIVGGSAVNGGQGCSLNPAPPNQADLDSVARGGGTGSAFIVDAVNGNTAAQFLDALNRIRGAATIPCEFQIPQSPTGKALDLYRVNVNFTPTGGSSSRLPQAADVTSCPVSGGWAYDAPTNPGKILICGATCDALKSDPTAGIDIYLGCATSMVSPH